MTIGILNKGSVSLPGGTKAEQPGGDVWISELGSISEAEAAWSGSIE